MPLRSVFQVWEKCVHTYYVYILNTEFSKKYSVLSAFITEIDTYRNILIKILFVALFVFFFKLYDVIRCQLGVAT